MLTFKVLMMGMDLLNKYITLDWSFMRASDGALWIVVVMDVHLGAN